MEGAEKMKKIAKCKKQGSERDNEKLGTTGDWNSKELGKEESREPQGREDKEDGELKVLWEPRAGERGGRVSKLRMTGNRMVNSTLCPCRDWSDWGQRPSR